jgi:hypothetical protein
MEAKRTLKFDLVAFVRELEKLGLRLSAIRHLDGSVRLYRWRQMNYWQNEAVIKQLWDECIGNDENLIAQLAESLANLNVRSFDLPARSPSAA